MMNTLPTDRQTGIPCPDCGTLIPVAIADLFGTGIFVCRCCSRMLTLMRQESAQALTELQKVREAQQNLDRKTRVNL